MDTQDPSFAAPVRPRLWRRWPVTTLAGLAGLISLGVVMTTGTAIEELGIVEDADMEVVDVEHPFVGPLSASEDIADVEVDASGTIHRGEEGKLGKPTSKSGLYAMKGPKDAGHFLASPYGGAFAVGSDDADVWGGLTGTEVGEAYGVGGLGLVGTGRGGGGTGVGTIGYGGGSGRADVGDSHYDRAIQSRVLTVGTVDDNADPAGYRKALERMASARAELGLSDDVWHIGAPGQRHALHPRGLDIALVIDTTGSMGDELEYLKVELRDIATKISKDFPGVQQRWALVVYRDHGDAYVARQADFRGIDAFITALGKQAADGGGDLPEAMDVAMATSAELSWRAGQDTARMVFLVADAPSHSGDAARRFSTSVLKHRAAGTAIFPVAASGVTPEAEAELRLAAKVTGGQYIFLTDHSGVGGHHAAPHVDQYKVETLHDAMARMIRGELGDPAHGPKASVQGDPTPPVVLAIGSVYDEPVQLMLAETPGLSVWEQFKERLAAHLMFASSMALLMFAAIGVDAVIARRRRMQRAYRG